MLCFFKCLSTGLNLRSIQVCRVGRLESGRVVFFRILFVTSDTQIQKYATNAKKLMYQQIICAELMWSVSLVDQLISVCSECLLQRARIDINFTKNMCPGWGFGKGFVVLSVLPMVLFKQFRSLQYDIAEYDLVCIMGKDQKPRQRRIWGHDVPSAIRDMPKLK